MDELKAIESNGGTLTSHEKKVVEELEKDIKAVKKAREVLGDSAPTFHTPRGEGRGDRGRGGGVLGKRRRDGAESDESDDDIPEDVKSIPMPRDTPPPIPKEILDKWYQARREKYGQKDRRDGPGGGGGGGTKANNTPLGGPDRGFGEGSAKPVPVAQTVYEAKPMVRDLRKEAVSAFMPAAVRAKIEKVKGFGGLVEPEEADKLEKEGYIHKTAAEEHQEEAKEDDEIQTEEMQTYSRVVHMEEVDDEDG